MAYMNYQLEAQVVQRAMVASGYPIRVDGVCGGETLEALNDWLIMHVGSSPSASAGVTVACAGRAVTVGGESYLVRQIGGVLADLARTVGTREPPVPGTRVPPPVVSQGEPTQQLPRRRGLSTAFVLLGSAVLVTGLGYLVYKEL